MYTLTDTHCHLNYHLFDGDIEMVLMRAEEQAIKRILIPGIDIEACRKAVQLSEQYSIIYAAVGIHPNDATTWNDRTLSELSELAIHPKVVAIGEIGLDYYRDRSPIDLQKKIFEIQLDLALKTEKPIIVHNRQATTDILEILAAWHCQLVDCRPVLASNPGVLHAFSGDFREAMIASEHNFYLGVAGPVTYPNAVERQKITSELPLSHVILETDAPFLSPHPYRGQRNEPANISLIARKMAELVKTSLEVVARTTSNNANRLFGWGGAA